MTATYWGKQGRPPPRCVRRGSADVPSGDAVDLVGQLKEESGVPLLAWQPVDEPGADGRRPRRPRPGDALPVITGRTGLDPIFQGAADFDLELIEGLTLDSNIQELIYRPTLH